MQTKDKILEAALALYNSNGVNNITTRHIAASINISAGNLHYHFKHTDDIIQALYDRLSGEFDGIISRIQQANIENLESLSAFAYESFELVYKYRFIFLGFVDIGARIPSIKAAYQQLMRKRKREFKGVFRLLVSNGTFRDDIPDTVWTALVTQIFIVADFWLSNNELTLQLEGKKAINHYTKVFEAMFFPYMR
ncbi:transcriptional regulator, TetR family [Chitinophaga terrae (ex Kim and Jung 2007)]|uniref:Transcriptional regulator, TetR family n=1 Tax=Chitinophaga terrae (ex Kim and Jung 2007) TaxID=408074 RepID=A0A1H4GFP2_9BACT|nr:TetR/AcrR family transcriptional regulator [Chitinophaga terrae (ex Kim and Jung 2007)]MDQ0110054.1 AcrR family transcriptional regulator [Chitinophaga terrae (ex Kim and Jung 2007)]GEP93410.1 hypothetical protein CTE07_50550 [Chitinophaga terrae (ex Kim and Jung 2007)]SEB08409.1 transcriptional regulator, TetR family [Chitinophaga terrae (ex Kim and Jung 2007)]